MPADDLATHLAVARVRRAPAIAGVSGDIVVLDDHARTAVLVAGGHPQTVFRTTFGELQRIPGGTAATVS